MSEGCFPFSFMPPLSYLKVPFLYIDIVGYHLISEFLYNYPYII